MNITHLGGNAFRLRAEVQGASFAVDLTLSQVFALLEDGLEAVVAHVGELDACPFCDDDGACDLTTLLMNMREEVRKAHP